MLMGIRTELPVSRSTLAYNPIDLRERRAAAKKGLNHAADYNECRKRPQAEVSTESGLQTIVNSRSLA